MGCDGIPSRSVQQSIADCNNDIAIRDKRQEKSVFVTMKRLLAESQGVAGQ
jgi:hypothetical protein